MSDLAEVLLPKAAPKVSIKIRWATVTQATPLRIRLDNDATPLPFTPASLVTGLKATNRALVVLAADIPIVIGAFGGVLPPELEALLARIDTLEGASTRSAYATAAGRYSGGSVAQPHTGMITLPPGRFTVPPIIVATIDNSAGGTDGLLVTVGNVTASNFQLVFMKQSSAATQNRWCTATWVAIQMTPTAAGG